MLHNFNGNVSSVYMIEDVSAHSSFSFINPRYFIVKYLPITLGANANTIHPIVKGMQESI